MRCVVCDHASDYSILHQNAQQPQQQQQHAHATTTHNAKIQCPAPGAPPVIVVPRVMVGASCDLATDPVAIPAAECRSPADALVKCTPVACSNAGLAVPLAGTCRSAFDGATFKFWVDGVEAAEVVCPEPGVAVRVQPFIDAYGGKRACTYR